MTALPDDLSAWSGPARPGQPAIDSEIQLCCQALRAVECTGLTGVTLARVNAGGIVNLIHASDDLGTTLLGIHETVVAGPLGSALESRGPVLAVDLAGNRNPAAWLPYINEALTVGVRSVLVFPIQVGAVMLGLLTLHGTVAVTVSQHLVAELAVIADQLVAVMIRPPPGIERAAWERTLVDVPHAAIHQAAGIVMVQQNCTIEDAMASLRARAFADGVSPLDLARQIVQGRDSAARSPEDADPYGRPHPEGSEDE